MENFDFTSLYSDKDKQVLKVAEDSLDPRIDRVHEIIEYALEAKIKRIGIANCTTFNKEAEMLAEELAQAGFEVETVNCKFGRVPFNDLLEGYKGTSCNPVGQAKYLENKNTELNIMMGLCVGHDILFNSKSKAPVTPLLVKDRKRAHHTLGHFHDMQKGQSN
jgi:uncharacterized metal-binding protein